MVRRRSRWQGLTRSRVLGSAPVVAVALLAMVSSPSVARAAPGAFDPTFGSGGKQTLNFGGTDRATHVVITPDGRVVAVGSTDATGAGDFAVARLKADGSPDDSFGSGGKTSLGTTAGVNDIGGGVVVLPDERIVVAGQGGAGADFITKRLNADGTVDAGFAGTGTSTVDFGGTDSVTAMIRQPADGKLILVGSTSNGNNFAIARLNADGTPDTGFSGDGKQTVDFGGADAANAVALTADGKIVVAGQGGPAGDMVVTRLTAGGDVDASFAPTNAGKAYVDLGGTDVASGVAVQPDGKIVLAGATSAVGSGAVAVARLDANGALDPGFSDDGTLTLDYGTSSDVGYALALQQNGRIAIFSQGGAPATSDFKLARLSPDGTTDASFGTSGTATLDFGGAEFDGDVAVQPDGQLVTVGSTNNTAAPADGADLAFTRVDGDPPTTTPPPAPPSPSFSIRFSGTNAKQVIAVRPGLSVNRAILVTRNSTSTGAIRFSVRKLPKGLHATIGPSVNRPGGKSVSLRLTADLVSRPFYVKNGLVTATPEATAGSGAKSVTFRALVQTQLAAWIDGLEVTQGVQTDDQPRHIAYDGVRLMRGKKTIVRAFVDLEGVRPPKAPGVTAVPPLTVALYGTDANGRALPGSPLLPDWSPPVSGLRRNQAGLPRATRESSRSAYVFVLPEQWTRGPTRLLAKPIAPKPSLSTFKKRPEPLASTLCTSPACGALNAPLVGLNFFLPPKPRVISLVKIRFILTGKYTGDVVPAARAFDKLISLSPIPLVFLNGAGQRGPYPDYSGVATTSDGITEKTSAWDDANRHPGDFVVGVFAYPPGAGYAPGPRVAVADAADSGNGSPGRPVTVDAHEMLHLLGLGHADTACGGSKRTSFPDADGRSRSVGMDTTGDPPFRTIPDDPPNNPGFDLMSYCGPESQHWISARNWSALLGVPTPVGRRAAKVATGSFLVLRARESAGRVDIHTVQPSTLGAAPAAPSAYRLVARNASGAVVADAPVAASVAEQAAPAIVPPFTALEGRVPAAGVARLEVVRDGAVVASIDRSPSAPAARLLAPASRARLRGDRANTVRWTATDADGGTPDVSLEYSANGGGTYRTVAQGEGTGRVTLPARLLASAAHGRMRLRVTDGFNTTVTAARPVVVLASKPLVTITDPRSRQKVQGGAELYMHGFATDSLGRAVSGRRMKWYAGKKLLGTGGTLSAVLPAGARGIRLVARDRSGRTGSASVGIRAKATTPLFLRLTAPRKLSRRAKTLSLLVAATQPATLRLGKQHHAVGHRARRVRFKVRAGRSTLKLRFVLTAGSARSAQYVVVPRK